MTEAEKHLFELRFQALHTALANRLYHQKCAAVFELRDRLARLAGLIGASAVFMTIASTETAKMWALLSFVGASASLIFRWSEKARLASEKMMQYAAIQTDIQRVGEWDYNVAEVNDWTAKLAAITEPAPSRILWDRACHSASLALKSPDVQPLTWLDQNCPSLAIPIP